MVIAHCLNEDNSCTKLYGNPSKHKLVIARTRNYVYRQTDRPDRTGPDQTRPDQTRPDQTRPDEVHSYNLLSLRGGGLIKSTCIKVKED